MKRIFCLFTAALILLMCAVPAVCAATKPVENVRSAVHDENFNVELATVLIVMICSVVFVALVVICIILAKRNINN